jgi:uncharacterized protein YxjI
MINKNKLVDSIEKYYLNGLTESVKFSISNNNLVIPFSTTTRDVTGKIVMPIELNDAEFGIFETSPFLKLLKILDTNIEIEYQQQYSIIEKLLIEDNQYKMMFSVSDISLIPKTPNVIDIEYQLTYDIEPDFVTRFIDCKKALGPDVKTFVLEPQAEIARIILGDPSGYANKLEFEIPAKTEGFPFSSLLFPSDVLKEILIANKNFDSGIMKVNEGGLMYLMFTEEDVSSQYYIMASAN